MRLLNYIGLFRYRRMKRPKSVMFDLGDVKDVVIRDNVTTADEFIHVRGEASNIVVENNVHNLEKEKK